MLGMAVLATLLLGYALLLPEPGLGIGTSVVYWTFGLVTVLGPRFTIRESSRDCRFTRHARSAN